MTAFISIIVMIISVLLCVNTPVWAQATGTCDQYHPGIGGQFCVNNGTASGWKNLTGDVANVYNNGHCSPTDSSQCGKITVQGLQGSAFNGTISDGQGWCYQLSSNSYIPCAAGTSLNGYTGVVNIAGTGSSGNPISNVSVNGVFNVTAYGAKGDNVTDDNAAITSAYAAACAAFSGPNATISPSVYLPKPSVCYLVAEPLLLSCAHQVQLIGDSDFTSEICGNNDYPLVVAIPSTYAAQSIGTISAASLATGSGAAMNFASATPWYLNASDAMSNFFGHAYPLNGLSQIDVRLFFNTGSLAHIQNMLWVGGNPTAVLSDFCGGGGSQSGEDTLCVVPNGALCYKLTTGGTTHDGCGAAGAVTTGTTHEAEMAYNGSNIYVFLDGTQITGSPFAATGTITQSSYTDILIGTGGQAYPDWGSSSDTFVGQMDSYQISNVARHTANYTADTTKFTSDSNTLLLINGTTFKNPLIAADRSESVSDGWLIARGFGPQGASTSFKNLSFYGGTIGIFQALEPGPKYENVRWPLANWIGLELWNNTYEARLSNLSFQMASTSEAAITAAGAANAETLIAPQIGIAGYHAIEGFDLSAHILNPFISPTLNSVDGFYDNCDNDLCGVSLLEPIDDVENGGSAIPLYLVGSGNYSVYSGSLVGGTSAPCVQVQPAGGGNKLNLNIYGTTCGTNSPAPAELVNVVGANPLKAPVTWYSATANGLSYSAQTAIPWTNVPADLVVYGDVNQLPAKTFATLPTSPINGMLTYCSDCTIANPCAASGTGAVAKRLNSVWVCN